MPDPIITVDQISKKFVISHETQERYKSFRDEIAVRIKALAGNGRKRAPSTNEEFYALKDVSFEVHAGDRLGIIGRNGAGKSTLLKILSRITEPSKGRIRIRGRVASLLEVGTGFHPELTGRENVFLNGAILGMSRAEIRKKFDEIVSFAEVEKFLDTPVKRYSSGMYVRLAFAVAAYLEPEILVVDEVLAVGDAQFQKKCLGKMEDVSKNQGRTVLFVSHQMGTIAQLCDKSLLLNRGQIIAYGLTNNVIDQYINSNSNADSGNKYAAGNIATGQAFYFREAYSVNDQNQVKQDFAFDEKIILRCVLKMNRNPYNLKVGVTLQNIHGYYVSTSIHEMENRTDYADELIISIGFPVNIIAPNSYYFRLALFDDSSVYEVIENICSIRVLDTGTELSKYEGINYGSVILKTDWSFSI
jgi:lipopolysaccharide transport system ATP-binding protein